MIDVSNSLSDQLKECFGERITVLEPDTEIVTIQIPVDEWLEVAQTLRDDARFAFCQLTDLCGIDYLSFGQVEWETDDATHDGFSRGVEGLGPGRFNWAERPESNDAEQRFSVVAHLLSITHTGINRCNPAIPVGHTGRPLIGRPIELVVGLSTQHV